MEQEKYIIASSTEQGEQSGMEDHGRKMSRKSAGVMENDLTRTAEETREDDERSGGRDMV